MNSAALQPTIEHVGIAVSAVSGVLAARGKRVDLFGVLVLAFVTAYGGGTARDVLVGDLPPVWLRSSDYLWNVTITAVVTFYLVRWHELPQRVLLVADACGLALFTLIGARKGVALEFTPAVSVMLGVVTGVAGGILRDVLLGEVPFVFRREIHLYATAALAGAALYVTLHQVGVVETAAVAAGMTLILVLRLIAIRWKIGLPLLEAR